MPALSDQTLLHVLVAIQIDLTNALNRNINPIDAFGIAVRTAENFSTNCVCTQSFGTKICKALHSILEQTEKFV